MPGTSPCITLNNGVKMPALGLGVYLTPPEQTAEAVEAAIGQGYRLFDTAAVYGNERQLGEGIRRSGVHRAELFLITKLWVSDYGYDRALHAFDVSLQKLGLEYIDLYLLHWPVPSDFGATLEAYRAAEKTLAEGRVRAIGVSNFNPGHLENLIARSKTVPAVNQVELNPFFAQPALRQANARQRVVTQSWSPIGGINQRRIENPGTPKNLLEHPVVRALATKHGKTPAQIVLRWHIDHGCSAIPKSIRPKRIAENIDIFAFALAPDDIAAIDALDTGIRVGPDPDLFNLALSKIKTIDEP